MTKAKAAENTGETDKKEDDKPEQGAGKKVVEYKGSSDARLLSVADRKTIRGDDESLEDLKPVTWDQSNNWQVPADEFSEAEMLYLDKTDDGFKVVEKKG